MQNVPAVFLFVRREIGLKRIWRDRGYSFLFKVIIGQRSEGLQAFCDFFAGKLLGFIKRICGLFPFIEGREL